MSKLLDWLRACLRNTVSERFLHKLAANEEICQLFAIDGHLYISYKRESVKAMHPNDNITAIERGLKHAGLWCPDHGVDEYGWKTWTFKKMPIALPALIQASARKLEHTNHVNITKPKHTYAPAWLNTQEWNRVFLPREPRPPNIDGSWINNL